MKGFNPIMRFAVTSDVHCGRSDKEIAGFEKGMRDLYKIAENEEYDKVDALFVVGDFTTEGSEAEMLRFKKALDEYIKPETEIVVSMSSHEYRSEGEEKARERFARIFNMDADVHKVIKGFHFVSVTSTKNSTRFLQPQIDFVAKGLEEAHRDDAKKPIFVFQHPHITGTVYGSTLWGEDDLNSVLVNYPQIIDFSGHSHAPINDPRSIHQQHFTCLGTGTFSYFELDEFDKIYGTVPPDKGEVAQFLIVEVDENNRVRVYPYDVITGNFFPYVWEIDEPSNPDSFLYTDEKRYKTNVKPYFEDTSDIKITQTDDGVTFDFAQAKISEDYVNDYIITVRRKCDNAIEKRFAIWSSYYFYNMPERVTYTVNGLEPGEYSVEVRARGFWYNYSDERITAEFSVLS